MKKLFKITLLLTLFATPLSAYAQGFAFNVADHSASVGTTAVVLEAAPAGHRRYVFLQNLSTTATIYCTFDGTTPTASGLGTRAFGPGAGFETALAGTEYIPQGAISCIASAASTPVTLKVYEPVVSAQ